MEPKVESKTSSVDQLLDSHLPLMRDSKVERSVSAELVFTSCTNESTPPSDTEHNTGTCHSPHTSAVSQKSAGHVVDRVLFPSGLSQENHPHPQQHHHTDVSPPHLDIPADISIVKAEPEPDLLEYSLSHHQQPSASQQGQLYDHNEDEEEGELGGGSDSDSTMDPLLQPQSEIHQPGSVEIPDVVHFIHSDSLNAFVESFPFERSQLAAEPWPPQLQQQHQQNQHLHHPRPHPQHQRFLGTIQSCSPMLYFFPIPIPLF